MTVIKINGVDIEIPEGWGVSMGKDGRVEFVPPSQQPPPQPQPQKTEQVTKVVRHSHLEATYQSVTTGTRLHLNEPDREIVRQATQKTLDFEGTAMSTSFAHVPPQPVAVAVQPVLPAQPKIEWRTHKPELDVVVDCVWDVLRQGGWHTVGAVANRLGVPDARDGHRASIPEYSRVRTSLEKLCRAGYLVWAPLGGPKGRGLGAPKIKRAYAEAQWARTHPRMEIMRE